MNPINRAIAVLTQPRPTMSAAVGEPATTGGLVAGYAAILALLPAIGGLLSALLFSYGYLGAGIGYALVLLVLLYLIRDLGIPLLIGFVAGALAPSFGGRSDRTNAMKLVIYAATPIWIAGFIFALLGPAIGGLAYLFLLLGFAYGGYLLYLGSGPLLGIPQNQAPIVAGILTVAWLVLWFIANEIVMRIFFSMMIGSAMRGYGY